MTMSLVDRILSVYSRYQSFPILLRARISPALPRSDTANFIIESEWEQKDVVREEKCQFSQHHFLSTDQSNPPSVKLCCLAGPQLTVLGQGFPFPKENGAKSVWTIYKSTFQAVCISYERSVRMKAAAPATQACCPESGVFVQIWNEGRFVKTIRLPTTGPAPLHGRVYPVDVGAAFGGACWSHDSKKIVYTAEASTNSPESKYTSNLDSSPFRHRENWGEGLEDTQCTVLCLLDVDSECVQVLVNDDRLPGMAPTQPIWCPNDTGIVFAAYAMGPYRLGLKYCYQRPCQLFHLELGSMRISTLSDLDKSANCARFSPDGRHLVWLENSVGGPHMQCRALMHLNWPLPLLGTLSPTPIVPIIDQPDGPGGFPGLYLDLPLRCWTSNSSHVILSTMWGFERVMLIVAVTHPPTTSSNHLVYPVASPLDAEGPSSVCVLDVCHDVVVASITSPTRPPFLGVLPLPNDSTELKEPGNFKWTLLPSGCSESSPPLLSQIRYSVLPSSDSANCSESLLIRPHPDAREGTALDTEHANPDFKSPALIVWPHGGPHSAFSASWEPTIASLVHLGFACLLVNYRGSLGYGDTHVRSLLGRIGDIDVADCVEATKTALNTLEAEFNGPRPKAHLCGGSHGGFLVLHLAARFPHLFKAAVARNPVANLLSAAETSDIPDWMYTETGLTEGLWPMGSIMNSVALEKVSLVSPTQHLRSDWTVPLLMLLGEQDRRVPPSQGLTFCRRLKALNLDVPCEIIVYPHDSHPLESPVTAKDYFLRTVLWFLKHA